MLTTNDYCPECGGIRQQTQHVVHAPQFKYHSDYDCSFRWNAEMEGWEPGPGYVRNPAYDGPMGIFAGYGEDEDEE